MQGTKIGICPIENLSPTRKFSVRTLVEEMEPVALVNNEFEYREKLKLGCFLWKFRTTSTLMQEKKNNDFVVEYSLANSVFSIEILMEEIEKVAQNYKFKNRAKLK